MGNNEKLLQIMIDRSLDEKLELRADQTKRSKSATARALLEWALLNSQEQIVMKPAAQPEGK